MNLPGKIFRERCTDWLGCLAAVALCISLLSRSSTVRVLLTPTLIHNAVIALSFLIRSAARARTTSMQARLAAYGTTFLVPVYTLLVPHWLPDVAPLTRPAWVGAGGAVIWLVGCVFGVWGVWNLRYSFSIEPQARGLVTSGPYRFARHPIYTAYLLQYAGVLLLAPSIGFCLLLGAWLLLAWTRIRFEERLLASVFPEYVPYRARVGMFGPKLVWDRGPYTTRRKTGVVGEDRIHIAVPERVRTRYADVLD